MGALVQNKRTRRSWFQYLLAAALSCFPSRVVSTVSRRTSGAKRLTNCDQLAIRYRSTGFSSVTGDSDELVKHALRALRDTLPSEVELTTKVRINLPSWQFPQKNRLSLSATQLGILYCDSIHVQIRFVLCFSQFSIMLNSHSCSTQNYAPLRILLSQIHKETQMHPIIGFMLSLASCSVLYSV